MVDDLFLFVIVLVADFFFGLFLSWKGSFEGWRGCSSAREVCKVVLGSNWGGVSSIQGMDGDLCFACCV